MIEEKTRLERFEEMIQTRGFYFPSAEIYSNSFAGFYEYGPIGNKIRLNIINFWRKELVQAQGFQEIFGTLILPKDVFVSSGHLTSFDDPIATCSKCKETYKLDKLISSKTGKDVPEKLSDEEYKQLIEENKIVCEKCKGQLGEITRFNLMASISVGATGRTGGTGRSGNYMPSSEAVGESGLTGVTGRPGNYMPSSGAIGNTGYLRGESCQSIFLDFQRLYKTGRDTLPIGISQHGLVYRNEISPRNGLLRGREFEQLESELFFDPDKINDYDLSNIQDYKIRFKLLKDNQEKDYSIKEIIENKIAVGNIISYYLYVMQEFIEKIGIAHDKIRFKEVSNEDRAFYSLQTFDFEVMSSFGWIELFSLNYRTDHDLSGHSKGSKKDLSVKEDGKVILPHILEVSSIGLGRLFYVLLENSFSVKEVNDEQRNVLLIKPRISPYFCSVLPLVKKDGLFEKAQELLQEILDSTGRIFEVFFDEKGSIGKRYARLDEIGSNFSITIDHQTLEDKTITLRDRDSFEQKRIKIDILSQVLLDLYFDKTDFKKL